MNKRKSADSMEQLYKRIMKNLAAEGWSSPTVMASRGGFAASPAQIRERCEFLRFAELVYSEWDGAYGLTTWGELYLEGEIDAEHQPVPTIGAVEQAYRV